MKQAAIILIFFILLVQAGGYNLIIRHMQRQAYEQMVSRIDRAEYNEDDLIEISAPLNLPYYTDWQDFERRDGQVTINGVVYNYVARKYTNNVMVYKCIRNEKQQHINDVKKHIDDITFSIPLQSKQKKQAASLFSSLGEYDNAGCLYNCTAPASIISRSYAGFEPALRQVFYEQPSPPPDLA